jgi:multidrug efflux pump subunit AcrB
MTLAFSVVFIFLVLAAQFESFLHPFTILMTLPLAGVGAFGALYALDMTMNIFSFIGLIMLMGLVTKNGILLVDYANVLQARGNTVMEAAREAAQIRFRPVLMTAVSTILGMMPIALGYGAGGAARSPMGMAITMGMLAATGLTLIIIPVVYTLFDSLQRVILRHRALFLLLAAILAAGAAFLVTHIM